LETWADAVSKGWKPRAFEERLDPEARARETLVFSLRRLAGIGRAEFLARTGFDPLELAGGEARALLDEGLLEAEGDRIRLADRALFVSDSVFSRLV